jgi:hypothetical protein
LISIGADSHRRASATTASPIGRGERDADAGAVDDLDAGDAGSRSWAWMWASSLLSS